MNILPTQYRMHWHAWGSYPMLPEIVSTSNNVRIGLPFVFLLPQAWFSFILFVNQSQLLVDSSSANLNGFQRQRLGVANGVPVYSSRTGGIGRSLRPASHRNRRKRRWRVTRVRTQSVPNSGLFG